MAQRPTQQNVSSNNQSGGITAHTVSDSRSTSIAASRKRKPSFQTSRIFAWAGGIVAFLAATVAILEYLGIHIVRKP